MRTLRLSLALLATLTVGCEHKSKSSAPAPNAGTGSAAMGGGGAGEGGAPPAAQPPAAQPPAQVAAPAGDASKEAIPPTAQDLEGYLKDVPGQGKLVATFDTSMGAIHCELFGDKAPMTVANFVGLATGKKAWKNPTSGAVETGKPFYEGLTFHRVIPEFMIQGGDPMGVGRGGPGYKFGDETSNGLTMQPGVLAMANAGPGTNGSQFFITEVGPSHLNGKHTIFGQCKEVELVKQIARVPQDPGNKPNTPVTMKVTISKMQSW